MDGSEKSVYSLVLMNRVVEGIDGAAHLLGTSRSNLINQVLADYLSLYTPERRMKDIFDEMLSLMGGSEIFQVQAQPSDAMLSIRSALRYRYKPTIRYGVELYRGGGAPAGELRVSIRTQSQPVLEALEGFAGYWGALEARHLGKIFPEGGGDFWVLTQGRLARPFFLPKGEAGESAQGLALAITQYIQYLDRALKYAFEALENPAQAAYGIGKIYEEYFLWAQKNGALL